MRRVLIVGDDRARRTLSESLEPHDFAVMTAGTAQEALDHLQSKSFRAVIAGLHPGDQPWVALLDRARAIGIDARFVILRESTGSRTPVDCPRLGALNLLSAPVEIQDLMRVIDLDSSQKPGALTMPAHARWADLVVQVLGAPRDPRTACDWAALTGHSKGTIENRCRLVGLSPKRSLDLARMLRAAFLAGRTGAPIEALLDSDPRTVRRLILWARLAQFPLSGSTAIDLDTLLRLQIFTRNALAIASVAQPLPEQISITTAAGSAADSPPGT